MKINHAVVSGGLVFIDFLNRFVIDHINCYNYSASDVFIRRKSKLWGQGLD